MPQPVDPYSKIRPIIENAFSNVPAVVILGSGASAAFGIPTMEALSDTIVSTNEKGGIDSDEKEAWEAFKKEITDSVNLEKAIEAIESKKRDSKLINTISEIAWAEISQADHKVYEALINGTKDLPLTKFLSRLLRGNNSPPQIITTNYDKLAEYAVDCLNTISYMRVAYYTGFTNGNIQFIDQGISDKPLHAGHLKSRQSNIIERLKQINIWKVHGSIDWYRSKATNDIICAQNLISLTDQIFPEIITPGLEKYRRASREPYRTIITEADNAIAAAHSCFAIGFGFRDEHIQEKLVANLGKRNIPTIVLTKQLTAEAKAIFLKDGVSNALLIEQHNKGSKAYLINKANQGGITEEIYDAPIWSLDTFVTTFLGE